MLTIADRQQITETLALHAFVVDENRLDQLGEVFTADATYDMTRSGMGAFQGIEAMGAAAGQMFASGRAPLSHFVTNIVITETGESTASVSQLSAVFYPGRANLDPPGKDTWPPLRYTIPILTAIGTGCARTRRGLNATRRAR